MPDDVATLLMPRPNDIVPWTISISAWRWSRRSWESAHEYAARGPPKHGSKLVADGADLHTAQTVTPGISESLKDLHRKPTPLLRHVKPEHDGNLCAGGRRQVGRGDRPTGPIRNRIAV